MEVACWFGVNPHGSRLVPVCYITFCLVGIDTMVILYSKITWAPIEAPWLMINGIFYPYLDLVVLRPTFSLLA